MVEYESIGYRARHKKDGTLYNYTMDDSNEFVTLHSFMGDFFVNIEDVEIIEVFNSFWK